MCALASFIVITFFFYMIYIHKQKVISTTTYITNTNTNTNMNNTTTNTNTVNRTYRSIYTHRRRVQFAPTFETRTYALEASERQMKKERYADIRMQQNYYYSSLHAAAEGRRREESQRCVRFSPAIRMRHYSLDASERQMKKERYADIRMQENYYYSSLDAAAEGMRRADLRSSRRQWAAVAAGMGVYKYFTRPILPETPASFKRIVRLAAAEGMRRADLRSSRRQWAAVAAGMGVYKYFTRPILPATPASFKRIACLAAAEGMRRACLRSSRRLWAAVASKIGVYKYLFRPILRMPAFSTSIGRVDLQAARSALRPIGELEEDDSGFEGGDIDFEDEDENENEVPNEIVNERGKRKTKRISTRQGTRASERLAARGLGSAFTLSGQRFSNRLANKLKLV
jgi:hypothetical protein